MIMTSWKVRIGITVAPDVPPEVPELTERVRLIRSRRVATDVL